jgi:hypothetical protein
MLTLDTVKKKLQQWEGEVTNGTNRMGCGGGGGGGRSRRLMMDQKEEWEREREAERVSFLLSFNFFFL